MRLQREVRLSVGEVSKPPVVGNSFAGNPSGHGLKPVITLKVEVGGQVDPATGMLVNIRQVDELVRRQWMTDLAVVADLAAPLLLKIMWPRIMSQLTSVRLLGLEVASNPWLRYRLTDGALDMIELTERFEFSAAHRLHSDALTDRANAETFGKCNNPHGHGHNYELEVTLRGPINTTGELISLQSLHHIVNRCVIERMDHKHLNIELEEFQQLNPTVENIAAVIFNLLTGEFPPPIKLQKVQLWETPKTSCTVEAPSEKELAK